MNHSCSHHSGKRGMKKVGFGIILVMAGFLLLLNNLGYLPFEVKRIVFTWQMLLIAIGFVNIFARDSKFSGVIMMLIGTIFLLPKLFVFPFEIGHLIWATVLVVIGLAMIFGSFRHRKHFNFDYETIENGTVDEQNFFGGSKKKLINQEFKGGKITNIFGGTEIDLTQSTLAQGKNVLDVTCVFGGVSLIVPSDWLIHVDVSQVLGGFADKRSTIKTNTDTSRELLIKGIAMFGGGELKSY